ncbi:UNVERIFIED_ORG: hypothetical protein J2Y76_000168 [Pseudomonas reinekei]|uniref:hypothetical protein n=1 Tax=Pseudomonas laurylsulfatiphila TaxID=2011015 RepID=UPI003D1E5B6D|nr:hypothetical protein [Pseudomonas reinekei]
MKNTDETQSFIAQLFVNNNAVALADEVIQQMLKSPDISEKDKEVLRKKSELYASTLLSHGENAAAETFLFAYHDDVYTIKIKDEYGQFSKTASMEGELRNLSVFEGDDPTYFRIINNMGESVKLNDLPEEITNVRLHTGPQRREVHTYGSWPNLPVLTDYEKRGGRLVFFDLKIIQRNISTAS